MALQTELETWCTRATSNSDSVTCACSLLSCMQSAGLPVVTCQPRQALTVPLAFGIRGLEVSLFCPCTQQCGDRRIHFSLFSRDQVKVSLPIMSLDHRYALMTLQVQKTGYKKHFMNKVTIEWVHRILTKLKSPSQSEILPMTHQPRSQAPDGGLGMRLRLTSQTKVSTR